jgi:hypothetical protein
MQTEWTPRELSPSIWVECENGRFRDKLTGRWTANPVQIGTVEAMVMSDEALSTDRRNRLSSYLKRKFL